MQRSLHNNFHVPPVTPIAPNMSAPNDSKHSQDVSHGVDSLSVSNQSAISSGSTNRLADFFGMETFQMVLHNPTTAHQLLKFSQSRFCVENLEFLDKV
jgi:hypothetical protein